MKTVTLYAPPEAISVANWNEPLPVIERLSPALFCRTSPPLFVARFATVPPMTKVAGFAQFTVTLVTLAVAVPTGFATVHCCDGLDGCVRIVTLYPLPDWTAVAK